MQEELAAVLAEQDQAEEHPVSEPCFRRLVEAADNQTQAETAVQVVQGPAALSTSHRRRELPAQQVTFKAVRAPRQLLVAVVAVALKAMLVLAPFPAVVAAVEDHRLPEAQARAVKST